MTTIMQHRKNQVFFAVYSKLSGSHNKAQRKTKDNLSTALVLHWRQWCFSEGSPHEQDWYRCASCARGVEMKTALPQHIKVSIHWLSQCVVTLGPAGYKEFNRLWQNLGKDRCFRAGCVPVAWLSQCNFPLVCFTSSEAQLANEALLAAGRTKNAVVFPWAATFLFYACKEK